MSNWNCKAVKFKVDILFKTIASVTGAEKEHGPTGTRTQGLSLTVRALYH